MILRVIGSMLWAIRKGMTTKKWQTERKELLVTKHIQNSLRSSSTPPQFVSVGLSISSNLFPGLHFVRCLHCVFPRSQGPLSPHQSISAPSDKTPPGAWLQDVSKN